MKPTQAELVELLGSKLTSKKLNILLADLMAKKYKLDDSNNDQVNKIRQDLRSLHRHGNQHCQALAFNLLWLLHDLGIPNKSTLRLVHGIGYSSKLKTDIFHSWVEWPPYRIDLTIKNCRWVHKRSGKSTKEKRYTMKRAASFHERHCSPAFVARTC